MNAFSSYTVKHIREGLTLFSDVVLTLALLPLVLSAALDSATSRAYVDGAEAKVIYRVVDDAGVPVTNALAHIWFRSYERKEDDVHLTAMTDVDGRFVARHRTNEQLSCTINKEGYYQSSDRINYPKENRFVKDGKWQPYGEARVVVLKRIKSPIEMLHRDGLVDMKIPAYGQWLGFDFERYSFVPPFGEGIHSDVLLRFSKNGIPGKGYAMHMEVSFTNNPFAGAYKLKSDSFSLMRSAYQADEKKAYEKSFSYSYERLQGKRPVFDELGGDEYLVFRTRTRVDDKGQLVSALYGKIYGRWHFVGPRGMSISHLFLNIVPNDTNIEDKDTANHAAKLYMNAIKSK